MFIRLSCEEVAKKIYRVTLIYLTVLVCFRGATHSQSVNAGLDQEMPDGDFLGDAALTAAVANGSLSISRINDAVVRMLTPMFAVGLFDVSNTNQLNADVTSAEHTQLACDLSAAVCGV